MANPDPEIKYELAKAARPDAIVGTGRSDYPNQINNVLGFPFIFRGALDVRARNINDDMKLAASYALAALTKEPVMPDVLKAYNIDHLEFGRITSSRNRWTSASACGKRRRLPRPAWKPVLHGS
jgi:malate dehydrogenase (oxaloacetate-decarboxylating)(NADP+)